MSSILPQGRFQFGEQGQVGREPIDLGQGVPVQPPGGLGLVQDDLSLGHDTPEAVHVQVKGGVVILDRVEPFSHLRGDGKLLLDLPNQGLLRGLSGLDFSAGKLPKLEFV